MATSNDRALSIIQEKVELLTGERANGEKRAVRIAEIEAYLKTLNDKSQSILNKLADANAQLSADYTDKLQKEHEAITAEIKAAIDEKNNIWNKSLDEAKQDISNVRQIAQAARLEAHNVFQDAQSSIIKLREDADSAFSELADITETITDIRSDVDGNTAAITAEAGARASADTAIAGQITTINANISTNAAAITSEAVTRANADSALSTRIDNLVAASGSGFSAAIDAEATARIAADNALAADITTVSAKASAQRVFNQSAAPGSTGRIVGDLWYDSSNGLKPYYWNGTAWADNSDNRFTTIAASVTAETTARVNADSALSAQITSLTSTVDGNVAAINNEASTRASADSALSASISSLTSTVNNNTTAISNEAVTRANADSALSASLTSLTTTVNTNKASLDQEITTRANADSALASQISSLSTTVGNNSASITNLQGSYNGLSVKYGIVGTINGQTGGFVFSGIGKNDGSVIYNLEIGANVTINGSLIVNGTIKNQGLEDYAASNSGMSVGPKNSGNVSVRVRKNSRVACIVSYSPPAAWDNFSPTTLKISANGQTFYSVPVLNFFDYLNLPVTITAIYPGNVGTRIQGNGQASASAEYSYTEQYVAYYVWVGFPAPVYASRTVSFPAAYAFDDSQSSTWLALKSGSPWIKYIFAQSVQVGAYKVMGFSSLAPGSTQGRAPKAWSLQASNDGTNWTTIDTRSNQTGWGDQEDRQFQISGTNGVYNSYRQYRMVITESVDAGETLVGVVQLSFFLPGDVSDSQNVVFNAFIDSSSNFLGNVSIYVVELSK